jgi:multicomponent Na+:H+ antiporter subunit E
MTAVNHRARPAHSPAVAARFIARLALMALVWLGMNGTDWSSWIVGGPVVFGAAWVSVTLLPDTRWRLSAGGAIAFAGFFLRESLRGGWDVAWRALSPALPLSPAIVCFPLHLPPGPARLLFCGAISLLPGTAVVAIANGSICVHVLEASPRVETELRELEGHVAALFGLRPPEPEEAS